ncbi:chemotaxis protein CheB [Gimesia aquarii]|uniref:protein-glutamate O-methyltransferase n=1 Tax=Gimesia aquarii TaxID=2527964 RepID=A0A517X037_9PLAN|nr:chemotaxis protein CheB [Gimesia aquarii]QDU10872.1 Chemotaxis protein methyltransferase Cher2 [Gimesia aquarii]
MAENLKLESDSISSTTSPSFIVGIGASAGGLDPLTKFFDNIPSNSRLAFVIVQHLSPDYESKMDNLLSRHTTMVIHKVEHGMAVEANAIYLIPPRKNMILSDGKLLLTDQKTDGALNLPIDIFFQSLAQDAGDRSIAIVMSGTGSDGACGVEEIHESGGIVIVQDIDSAGFDGMPRSASATGTVDVVARPEAMPEWITRYITNPTAFPRGDGNQDIVFGRDAETTAIFRMFRQQYGIDFSYYKASTITRRLDRRVQLTNTPTLAEYLKRLQEDPHELDVLYRDLLVEVTQFFRDQEAFEKLKKEVIPEIVKATNTRSEIRVWVTGCATGEEAYSLAMLFDDCIRTIGSDADLKVFATDVHRTSLELASTGVYSREAVLGVPEEFRERYFQKVGELFHVTRDLRKLVIFAPHDITRDPPFTRIDLLSCRNVLIYLDSAVQKKVLSLFHFGLKVGGTLFLGPSESIGELDKEFDEVDRKWKILRKLRNVRLSHPDPVGLAGPPGLSSVVHSRPSFVSTATRPEKNWFVPEAYNELLNRYVPTSLLVNEHHELVHTFGESRHLLLQPEGKATLDITKMVEGDLRVALNAGLHKAANEEGPIVFTGVRTITQNGEMQFRITVELFKRAMEKMFLICLEEMNLPQISESDQESFDSHGQTVEHISLLEKELNYTRETLQATVEELETSNEELQSTNEELVASNEELQSTNEELHSVNEELHSVSAEHQRKIAELTMLAKDMDTLLNSTEIGIVFLDVDLKIRLFTKPLSKTFHIMEQDIGRPIEHIAHKFIGLNLQDFISQATDENGDQRLEVKTHEGETYQLQYHTRDINKQDDGHVLTFVAGG